MEDLNSLLLKKLMFKMRADDKKVNGMGFTNIFKINSHHRHHSLFQENSEVNAISMFIYVGIIC